MRGAFIIPVLILAATLAACVAQASPSHQLAESTWRFVSIDGAKPVSSKANLSFTETNMSANVGCNGMGGPWQIVEHRLIAGPLMQTEMYCDGPVWDQEQAVSALLVAAPSAEIVNDTLVLSSRGHKAKLERIPRSPQD